MLRDYQQKAIDLTIDYLQTRGGNPCIVMPTGSGKSWVIAGLIKKWSGLRILVLTHSKELIQQDSEKIKILYPECQLGIYSEGLSLKQIREVTVGSIQSLYKKAKLLGIINYLIVDEAHKINHVSHGMYRDIINDLTELNPELRVIGLTATPYRTGHGLITDKPAIFDDLIEPTSIQELINLGWLAPLRNKFMDAQMDTKNIKTSKGDFVEKEMDATFNTKPINDQIVEEIEAKADLRLHWLIFCISIGHAEAIAKTFREKLYAAEAVHSKSPDRDEIIERFKSGQTEILCNVDILSTGFDFPDIDLIAFLRPTMSPGLYMQQAGRGMRVKSHVKDCLIFDFAGNVTRHGPVTNPDVKLACKTKVCAHCKEIVSMLLQFCPNCNNDLREIDGLREIYKTGVAKKEVSEPILKAEECAPITAEEIVDIMTGTKSVPVRFWNWQEYISKSGKDMLKVVYFTTEGTVSEYLCIYHDGYPGMKGRAILESIARQSGVKMDMNMEVSDFLDELTGHPPQSIEYITEGKFHKILSRQW